MTPEKSGRMKSIKEKDERVLVHLLVLPIPNHVECQPNMEQKKFPEGDRIEVSARKPFSSSVLAFRT